MHLSGGGGEGPLRSESARLPGVTLALAAPGPPVQLRWTTLRVQGPTLRDAALANDGDGSPPVARDPSPPPPGPLRRLRQRRSRGACTPPKPSWVDWRPRSWYRKRALIWALQVGLLQTDPLRESLRGFRRRCLVCLQNPPRAGF